MRVCREEERPQQFPVFLRHVFDVHCIQNVQSVNVFALVLEGELAFVWVDSVQVVVVEVLIIPLNECAVKMHT